ncbi:MAG: PDZ domain-containing protein [Oscillospiraceae bacterium]|nr:PDZ domain-containing protein [Oscillospiraceae bacterium]
MGKKISLGTAFTLILIAIAITFTLTSVFSLRNFNNKVSSITERENMYAKFTEIDNIVRIYHPEHIDENVLMDSVAKGYLGGIEDPYAKYMSAEEYALYLEASTETVAGVGVSVSMNNDGYMLVTEVLEGSTASSAGILVNDIIVKVDDISLSSETFAEAEVLLTGEAGTKVTLTVRRDSEDTEMEITRRVLTKTTVFSTKLDSFGYIRISDFSESTPDQFSKAVEKLISEGVSALIFDVRSVSTGLISAAAEMVDKMVGSGDILMVEYSEDHQEVLYSSNARETEIPAVVLINEGCAGASEFFAASLYDFGKAKTVGTQSTGFGSLQETFKLSDGSAVQLTTGKYILANSGNSWEGTGIVPDHVVTTEFSNLASLPTADTYSLDTQLVKALEVASSSVMSEVPEESDTSEENEPNN